MLIKQLSLRLEISFWQLIITLMYESTWVQGILRWGYRRLLPLVFGLSQMIDLKQIAVWGIRGFLVGLTIGIVIVFW